MNNWTKEKPTKPGFYWLRGVREKPCVAEVCKGPLDDHFTVTLTGNEDCFPFHELPNAEWSDPIEPPSD